MKIKRIILIFEIFVFSFIFLTSKNNILGKENSECFDYSEYNSEYNADMPANYYFI